MLHTSNHKQKYIYSNLNTITSQILICVKGNQWYHLRAQKQRKITKRNNASLEAPSHPHSGKRETYFMTICIEKIKANGRVLGGLCFHGVRSSMPPPPPPWERRPHKMGSWVVPPTGSRGRRPGSLAFLEVATVRAGDWCELVGRRWERSSGAATLHSCTQLGTLPGVHTLPPPNHTAPPPLSGGTSQCLPT